MLLRKTDSALTASKIIASQREFFSNGKTKDIDFRIKQLKNLKQAIVEHQATIVEALKADLSKPQFETYATEISVAREIDYAIKHLKSWCKPRKVAIPLEQFPSAASICAEPLGVVLIIGAWNYPFQLNISPFLTTKTS